LAKILQEAQNTLKESATVLKAIKEDLSLFETKIENLRSEELPISSQGQITKFKDAIARAAVNAGKDFALYAKFVSTFFYRKLSIEKI
jgi:hypothetical protein